METVALYRTYGTPLTFKGELIAFIATYANAANELSYSGTPYMEASVYVYRTDGGRYVAYSIIYDYIETPRFTADAIEFQHAGQFETWLRNASHLTEWARNSISNQLDRAEIKVGGATAQEGQGGTMQLKRIVVTYSPRFVGERTEEFERRAERLLLEGYPLTDITFVKSEGIRYPRAEVIARNNRRLKENSDVVIDVDYTLETLGYTMWNEEMAYWEELGTTLDNATAV